MLALLLMLAAPQALDMTSDPEVSCAIAKARDNAAGVEQDPVTAVAACAKQFGWTASDRSEAASIAYGYMVTAREYDLAVKMGVTRAMMDSVWAGLKPSTIADFGLPVGDRPAGFEAAIDTVDAGFKPFKLSGEQVKQGRTAVGLRAALSNVIASFVAKRVRQRT